MSAPEQSPKETLEPDSIAVLEEAATALSKMPDTPARAAKLAKFQKAFDIVQQKYEVPAEVLAPDAALMKALSYIPGVSYAPGLVRTAAGEAALYHEGKNTMEGAKRRITDALAPDMPFVESGPFARPALSAGEYTQMLGAEGPKWDAPLSESMGQWSPSKKTAMDFGLSMALDPALLAGGLKALLKKSPANTIEGVQAQLADELAKAKAAPTLMGKVKDTANFLTNPAETTGRGLENWRFADADKAAVDAGARPLSEVWREGGKPGITGRGLHIGKEKLMAENAATVQNLVRQVPTGEDLISRAKEFYTKTIGPEATAKMHFDDIPEEKLQIALGYKQPRSMIMDPLYSSEVEKNIATEGLTEPVQAARKNLEDTFKATANANPQLVAEHSAAKEAARPSELVRNPRTGEMEYTEFPNAPPPPPSNILDYKEKFYGPEELNRVAKSMQGIAASQRPSIYSAPDPTSQVLNRTEQRLSPLFQRAEGEMAADVGMQARNLQHETLAAIDPGLGAESLRATKNMNSLMKGGPFTEEAYTGPNPLSSRMNILKKGAGSSPITGALLDALTGSAETVGLGAGKALSSPWSVYGAQPIARGAIQEQAGRERQASPWYLLNRDFSNRGR